MLVISFATILFNSMERIANINIFLSACEQLKVKSLLTEGEIERLKPSDWIKMVTTLQTFANKMEKKFPQDPRKKTFKISVDNMKLSIDQLIKEWEELKLDSTYADLVYEDEIYMSPYEDSEFIFEDQLVNAQMVSCTIK